MIITNDLLELRPFSSLISAHKSVSSEIPHSTEISISRYNFMWLPYNKSPYPQLSIKSGKHICKLPSSKSYASNLYFCSMKILLCQPTFFFPFIFISWRLITLQCCSGFCHTLTWISHGFTCVPHPDPPSHLPLYPIPLGLPSAPGPSTCLMHPAWAGDLFHPR